MLLLLLLVPPVPAPLLLLLRLPLLLARPWVSAPAAKPAGGRTLPQRWAWFGGSWHGAGYMHDGVSTHERNQPLPKDASESRQHRLWRGRGHGKRSGWAHALRRTAVQVVVVAAGRRQRAARLLYLSAS